MDVIENKESNKREQISKNDEVNVSDGIEDLKVGKSSLHSYVDNVEIEYDKRNQVDMSDDKDSAERYDISKNNNKNLLVLMRNLSECIRQKKSKNKIQNQTKQKLMKDTRQKIKNYLKLLIAKK